MLFYGFLVVLIQVVFYQVVHANLCPRSLLPAGPHYPPNRGLIGNYNPGLAPGLPNLAPGVPGLVPTLPIIGRVVGGNLVIDTSSPNSPGVTIFSEDLIIQGAVIVNGNLPFTGTVALEGIVPATGKSAVSYECGSGAIGMVSENNREIGLASAGVAGLNGIGLVETGILPQNGLGLVGGAPGFNRFL